MDLRAAKGADSEFVGVPLIAATTGSVSPYVSGKAGAQPGIGTGRSPCVYPAVCSGAVFSKKKEGCPIEFRFK